MTDIQAMKLVQITPPAAIVNNAAFVTNVVDTKGFDYCTIVIQLGALDIALAALKLQESDTQTDSTTLTSPADITSTVFGTANNTSGSASTLPSATADNNLYAIHVKLAGRKRFLDLVVTGGNGSTGTFLSAFAILSRGSQVPFTTAARGTAQEMIVA